jgi:hypothetical protein
VKKGCNIFWSQKLANTCSFVDGRIIVKQEKFWRTETPFRVGRTTVLGLFKVSAIILDAIRLSFLNSNQQQQCLPQFESILDGHLSRHLLPAPFRL